MSDDKLIKEYVRCILSEDITRTIKKDDNVNKDKHKNLISKIVGFFKGTHASDEIAEDWIEDKILYFDIDIDDKLEEEIKTFAKNKLAKALQRTNDKQRAVKAVKKALDIKYYPKLKALEKQLSLLDDFGD